MTDQSADSLTIEETIRGIHVDREEELALFSKMIDGTTNYQIMLIEAESGMGKSQLLKKLIEMADQSGLQWAKVDFKNATYSFGKILHEMQEQLSDVSFEDLEAYCRLFLRNYGQTVGRKTLLSTFIDSTLAGIRDEDEQNRERQKIIDMFFGELAAFHEIHDRRVILAIDTFERAGPAVKEWLAEQFIGRSRLTQGVICVVAGQKTPSIDPGSEWCLFSKLEPLPDEHIVEYLHRLKLIQEDVIVKFVTSLLPKRDPAEIEALPRDFLIDLFTGIIRKNTGGKPAELRDIALDLATQDR